MSESTLDLEHIVKWKKIIGKIIIVRIREQIGTCIQQYGSLSYFLPVKKVRHTTHVIEMNKIDRKCSKQVEKT